MVQRIASLLSSATEILYGLGLGDQVVAVSHECDFPPDARNKPHVTRCSIDDRLSSSEIDKQVQQSAGQGQPLYAIDRSRLCQLAPDLIVTQAQCDVCAVRYEDVLELVRTEMVLKHTEVVALNPSRLEDVFQDIQRVGEATDRRASADQYVGTLRRRVAAVSSMSAAVPHAERPSVICIEWIEPLMLAANWTPQLIELAGGRNLLTRAGVHSGYAMWDEVRQQDPQVMVVAPCGFNLDRTLRESVVLKQLPDWHRLRAVRDGRVFAVDGSAYVNRSGPRLVDSLEILAHLFHPQLASPPLDPPAPGQAWKPLL